MEIPTSRAILTAAAMWKESKSSPWVSLCFTLSQYYSGFCTHLPGFTTINNTNTVHQMHMHMNKISKQASTHPSIGAVVTISYKVSQLWGPPPCLLCVRDTHTDSLYGLSPSGCPHKEGNIITVGRETHFPQEDVSSLDQSIFQCSDENTGNSFQSNKLKL